jgi:hypothetical protein
LLGLSYFEFDNFRKHSNAEWGLTWLNCLNLMQKTLIILKKFGLFGFPWISGVGLFDNCSSLTALLLFT